MKFCERHWTMAKDKIKAIGADHLIASSGEEAAQRAANGTDDPLMQLHWMIANRAMEALGPWLLLLNDDGTDRCPQCEFSKGCAASDQPCGDPNCADAWTEGAGNAIAQMLAEAKA